MDVRFVRTFWALEGVPKPCRRSSTTISHYMVRIHYVCSAGVTLQSRRISVENTPELLRYERKRSRSNRIELVEKSDIGYVPLRFCRKRAKV